MPMSQSLKMNKTGSFNNNQGYQTGSGGVKTGDLNNRLGDLDLDAPTNHPASSSMRVMGSEYQSAGNANWLNFGGQGRAPMERPTTASQNNAKVMQLENELRNEKREQKRLLDEIESLKKEI